MLMTMLLLWSLGNGQNSPPWPPAAQATPWVGETETLRKVAMACGDEGPVAPPYRSRRTVTGPGYESPDAALHEADMDVGPGRPGSEFAAAAPRPAVPQRAQPQAADAWFGEDKAKHFAMSFFTVTVTHAVGRAAGLENGPATAVGAATGVAAGLGKEWYDRRDHGLFSFRDLVWDAAGVALAVLFVRELR